MCRPACLVAVGFWAGSLLFGQVKADGPVFNRDIAPIVFQHCVQCHRPGESGPFPLLNYQQVRSHARQIAAVTQSRYMPPWLPAPGEFHFQDEHRLSDEQIRTIQRWVAAGSPEGQGPVPQPPHFEPGWQLGQPDLILRAAKPFHLPAAGSDVYWNFILPVPVDRTRWLRAVEIRPGDKRLVHHANILVDRLRSSRDLEKEPGAGFGGMELRVESEAFDPDSNFIFWKPGTGASKQPDGMALRIDKGTDLLLNVHMQPSGKPELIQPAVGLYFTDDQASVHPMLLELENDAALNIPAGAAQFEVTDSFELPLDVDLIAVYPHAHYLGKKLEATATYPDGTRKVLIKIPDWDLNWQGVYTYARAIFLPKGTTVEMRYEYDNSADNPRNPHSPPVEVHGGNRAEDEMAHLWLQVVPHAPASGGDPRLILQEAFSRHEVEKDPSVFEAQYNLAAMLMHRGATQEAIEHYRVAARLRSGDPVVNNALGSAEMAAGQLQSAETHLEAAIRARPGYFDAHYNLGLTLASESRFPAAEVELREAVRLNPGDADAHANYGAALAQLGDLTAARIELQEALRLNPDSELAKENLNALAGSQ